MCYFGDLTIIYFHLIFSRKDKYSGKKSNALLPLYHHHTLDALTLSLSLSLSRISICRRWLAMANNQASLLLQKQLKGLSFIFDSSRVSIVSLSLYQSELV